VPDAFLITCEHGGNRIPQEYRGLFRGQRALLDSHKGFDPGALAAARSLAAALRAPLVTSGVSRLLVDLNRSMGHPRLYSEATRRLPAAVRAEILAQYYKPYRAQVEALVTRLVTDSQRVIHVSSHSFTPELHGRLRDADVGLLYDPRRRGESALCTRWKASLVAIAPELCVRRNYPYAGRGDGLARHLRRRFLDCDYAGIELEVNQRIVLAGGRSWSKLRKALIDALRAACASA
jgi:predicted N-formylglutamate amidohydrolase